MFTLAAFYESIDAAGAYANIAAITDATIRTSGDDLYVPPGSTSSSPLPPESHPVAPA